MFGLALPVVDAVLNAPAWVWKTTYLHLLEAQVNLIGSFGIIM
jgi:hypothetical protein